MSLRNVIVQGTERVHRINCMLIVGTVTIKNNDAVFLLENNELKGKLGNFFVSAQRFYCLNRQFNQKALKLVKNQVKGSTIDQIR